MFRIKQLCLLSSHINPRLSIASATLLIISSCQLIPPASSTSKIPVESDVLEFPQHTDSTGNSIEAELARLIVQDEQYPGIPIQLGFVRFRGKGDQTIILLGDINHTATALASGPASDLIRELTQMGEVIAFDIRGSGVSSTLGPCPMAVKLPLSTPLTQQVYGTALKAWLNDCTEFFKQEGLILNQYAFNHTVSDVQHLISQLKAQPVSIIAYGKGAPVALAVAENQPDSVSALVLLNPEAEFTDLEKTLSNSPCSGLTSHLNQVDNLSIPVTFLTSVKQPLTLDITRDELKLIVTSMNQTGKTCSNLQKMLLRMSPTDSEIIGNKSIDLRGKLGRPNPAALAFYATFPTGRPTFEEAVARKIIHLPVYELSAPEPERSLLIGGAESLLPTTSELKKIAMKLQKSEVQIVPGGGDIAYLNRKDVIERITEFLHAD